MNDLTYHEIAEHAAAIGDLIGGMIDAESGNSGAHEWDRKYIAEMLCNMALKSDQLRYAVAENIFAEEKQYDKASWLHFQADDDRRFYYKFLDGKKEQVQA
jgi:hypothetical protein